MVKVLFIIWSLERGGAERFLVSLLKTLDKTKIESIVCCLNWKGDWSKEVEERGIKIVALNKKGKFDIIAFFELIKIIREGKFDIVNTYLWGADVLGRIAAISAGTPIIISTAQNVDIWKKWWQRIVDRLLSFRTNMIIAVSDAVKEYYHNKIGIPLSKIIVIHNAVELERFKGNDSAAYLYDELGIRKDDFILSCIGRLEEQKGQKYLIQALSLLNGKHNIKLLVVGDGPLKESHKSQVTSHKLEEKVIFTGYRSDIPKILEISNCLVLPSLYEGLPVCVLEAMAASKPVIATDIGGTNKLVKDGETGYRVAPRNAEALALAIDKLISLPDNGKEMGKKARELVSREFSIETIARKTELLFEELFNTKTHVAGRTSHVTCDMRPETCDMKQ